MSKSRNKTLRQYENEKKQKILLSVKEQKLKKRIMQRWESNSLSYESDTQEKKVPTSIIIIASETDKTKKVQKQSKETRIYRIM
jgi:hypothetical protein